MSPKSTSSSSPSFISSAFPPNVPSSTVPPPYAPNTCEQQEQPSPFSTTCRFYQGRGGSTCTPKKYPPTLPFVQTIWIRPKLKRLWAWWACFAVLLFPPFFVVLLVLNPHHGSLHHRTRLPTPHIANGCAAYHLPRRPRTFIHFPHCILFD